MKLYKVMVRLIVIGLMTSALGFIVGDGISRSEVGACGKCGDGYCAKQCGENAKSCPADCGGTVE